MAMVMEKIINMYNYIFYELADERTKYLFPSPLFMIILMPFYVYFSINLGPRLMRNVKPFELRSVMFVFNVFQIFICSYILSLGFRGGWLNGYNFRCQPVDMTENPQSRYMLNGVWWFTTVKIIDLLDTVFFVLRKKERQISFLHVLHHFGMPIASYIVLKYYPNGHGTLVGMINCIVHIVMYTYYLIAGLGPEYHKYLWWKSHLTTMQMVQFTITLIHNAVALNDSSCTYPRWISVLICFHSIQFIYMFGEFYYVNYIKEPKRITNGNTNGIVSNEKLKAQ